ncbi:MAG: DUF1700 domain-containing protein [Clostridia bacterium]|nr:DUF1700 domain-containing protein [Clostridia bacterium]
MRKNEFLAALRARLSALPVAEREERIGFYSEMIDDRIEEGLSEEEAVDGVGSVEDIADQILSEVPPARVEVKEKRKLGAGVIVLLALGSPIWLSLAVAAFAVLIAFYAVLWSLVAVVWSVFAALVAAGFGGIIGGITVAIVSNAFAGLALIAAALFCAGLAIFLFFGCLSATVGSAILTKKTFIGIKNLIVRKEKI